MKKILTFFSLLSFFLMSSFHLAFADSAPKPSEIYLNGRLINQPYHFLSTDPATGQLTTYMPIWYVMQLLQSLGISSQWTNTNWILSPSSIVPVDTTNPYHTSGPNGIIVDSVVLQQTTDILSVDPYTGQKTTYMPIWYIMQVLNRFGISSTWTNTDWYLTTPIKGSETLPISANQIVSTAKKYIGVPYVWGGENPKGFDCSGFVQYVFSQNGISLPRVAENQFFSGTVVPKNQLQPGDLLFFYNTYEPNISHVGIYIGSNQFIESSSSEGVVILSLSNPYYVDHYYSAIRVLQ